MSRKHLIIVMGVSGSGKTTVAKHISENTDFAYMESDQFHSEDNKQHMRSGRPLTDEMRWPWIEDICRHIQNHSDNIVLANSGLKRVHRDAFMKLDRVVHFIHIQVPPENIRDRLKLRRDHFMPASLLESQFRDLEMPHADESVFNIDGSGTLSEVTAASLACLENIIYPSQD